VLPRNRLLRLLGASWRQSARTPRCPDTPRLDGALAVVTGATAGIGFEIARGLARRGAELVVPCRSRAKGEAVLAGVSPAKAHVVDLDLEDLDGVAACADAIAGLAAGRSVDVLVENAGVWPRSYTTTRQGREIAFGVNVLAHFALRRALQRAGLLRAARVVVLTGDIWVCVTGDWAFELGFSAIGESLDFKLSDKLGRDRFRRNGWRGCDTLCIDVKVDVPPSTVPADKLYECGGWFELRCCADGPVVVAGYEALEERFFFR